MKRNAYWGLLFLALFVLGIPTQAAGIPVTVAVNEFGSGTYNTSTILPAGLLVDPSGGLPGVDVLVYLLPFTPVNGDLQIDETIGATVVLSDVVRFFTLNNVNYLIFYSDNGDGVDAPADTGLPGPLSTNVVQALEIGPEGNNGLVYTPTSGQPGFINTDFAVTYNITSDSTVPEPGTTSLLALGLAGLGLLKRFR